MMASDNINTRQMFAQFMTKKNENDEIVVKCGIIHLFGEDFLHPWRIKVTLKSFEVMHGLSTVMLLVPDKMATAIMIHKECLPDPDDGSFLIDLVQNLLAFYKQRHFRQNFPNVNDCEATFVDIQGSRNDDFNQDRLSCELFDVLMEFEAKLDAFKNNLRHRNDEEIIIESAHAILRFAEDLLDISSVYMNFVHPMILNISRNKVFEFHKCQELKLALNENLIETHKKLFNEFRVLIHGNELEQ